jgi:hypothetical protein
MLVELRRKPDPLPLLLRTQFTSPRFVFELRETAAGVLNRLVARGPLRCDAVAPRLLERTGERRLARAEVVRRRGGLPDR